ESAVELGVLSNRLLIRLAEALEWRSYERAGAVWAVTQGIRERLVKRGLPEKKVFLLRNGVDTQKFTPITRDEARRALGWDNRFTVLHAGTVGLAHGLDTALEAADILRDRADIHFIIAGEGTAKIKLQAEAARRALPNVTFLGAQPHERMPLLISGGDV